MNISHDLQVVLHPNGDCLGFLFRINSRKPLSSLSRLSSERSCVAVLRLAWERHAVEEGMLGMLGMAATGAWDATVNLKTSHTLPWEPKTFIFRGYNPYRGFKTFIFPWVVGVLSGKGVSIKC